MTIISASDLVAVGEFGSKAWSQACANASVKILRAANLPKTINWAFTENYSNPPARLIDSKRNHAGYYIMVKNGEVSAGDGIIEEALTLPGFHVQLPWGYIASQSGVIYGKTGQQKRSQDEAQLLLDIASFTGLENPFKLRLDQRGNPTYMLEPIEHWPPKVAKALGEGSENGNGLHNIAATLQSDSPEFADLPLTTTKVPLFSEMNKKQKLSFLALCGVSN